MIGQSQRNSRIRRRVGFDEDRNTTHLYGSSNSSNGRSAAQEDDECWGRCLDEFDDSTRRMKRKIKEWKMKGYNVLLRNVFDNPHTPTVQRNLNAFCQLDERDCARGNERNLSCQLNQKISSMKRQCIKTVLSHQRIMKKDASSHLSVDEMREELAVVSRMQSRLSVQFARRLAKADELAAVRNNDDDVSAALQLVEELNRLKEKQKAKAVAAGRGLITAASSSSMTKRTGPRVGRAARIA